MGSCNYIQNLFPKVYYAKQFFLLLASFQHNLVTFNILNEIRIIDMKRMTFQGKYSTEYKFRNNFTVLYIC